LKKHFDCEQAELDRGKMMMKIFKPVGKVLMDAKKGAASIRGQPYLGGRAF